MGLAQDRANDCFEVIRVELWESVTEVLGRIRPNWHNPRRHRKNKDLINKLTSFVQRR